MTMAQPSAVRAACEIVILSVGPAVSASLIAVLYVRLNQSPRGADASADGGKMAGVFVR
jgi:hypothetical protein